MLRQDTLFLDGRGFPNIWYTLIFEVSHRLEAECLRLFGRAKIAFGASNGQPTSVLELDREGVALLYVRSFGCL